MEAGNYLITETRDFILWQYNNICLKLTVKGDNTGIRSHIRIDIRMYETVRHQELPTIFGVRLFISELEMIMDYLHHKKIGIRPGDGVLTGYGNNKRFILIEEDGDFVQIKQRRKNKRYTVYLNKAAIDVILDCRIAINVAIIKMTD